MEFVGANVVTLHTDFTHGCVTPLPQVAVLAHGILSDDTPFEFGSSVPRISFSWSVTNMDSLSLVSVYEKVCVCVCV